MKTKILIMDVVIAVLVILNAAVVIAGIENNSDTTKVYDKAVIAGCFKNGEYGRAVQYTDKNRIVLNNGKADDTDIYLDECMAVSEYYRSEFFKKVYDTMNNEAKVEQMTQLSESAEKQMGSMQPLKKRIDKMLN